MANTSKKPATRAKRKVRTLAFPVEFRLRIVMLFLEESYSARLLVEQFGISTHSVQRWVEARRGHNCRPIDNLWLTRKNYSIRSPLGLIIPS